MFVRTQVCQRWPQLRDGTLLVPDDCSKVVHALTFPSKVGSNNANEVGNICRQRFKGVQSFQNAAAGDEQVLRTAAHTTVNKQPGACGSSTLRIQPSMRHSTRHSTRHGGCCAISFYKLIHLTSYYSPATLLSLQHMLSRSSIQPIHSRRCSNR